MDDSAGGTSIPGKNTSDSLRKSEPQHFHKFTAWMARARAFLWVEGGHRNGRR